MKRFIFILLFGAVSAFAQNVGHGPVTKVTSAGSQQNDLTESLNVPTGLTLKAKPGSNVDFTGANLIGILTVADWNTMINKPTFANVAFSGLNSDLSGPIVAPTINGVSTVTGATIQAPVSVISNAIDVTIPHNKESVSGNTTNHFSGTPVAGQITSLDISNTSGAAVTHTISGSIAAVPATVTLPANSQITLCWQYDGTNMILVSGLTTSHDLTLGVPGASDEGEFWKSGVGAQKFSFAGIMLTPTGVKTSSYTAAVGDFVIGDTTSGNVPILLPTAPADKTLIGGKMVTRGGTNTMTFTAGGSDVFDKSGGSTTATLTVQGQSRIWQYNLGGHLWIALSGDLPLSQIPDNSTITQNAAGQLQSAEVLNPAVVALTDAATITSTCSTLKPSQNWTVTLGGNRTLGTPSGLAGGMQGILVVKQDGTGTRTLALWSGAKVINGGSGAITLSTAANAVDVLTWYYDGTNTWWTYGKNFN